MDPIRDSVKQLIELVKQESRSHNMGAVCYPWVSGYLEAVLKGVPVTQENIQYLNDQIESLQKHSTGGS